MATKKTGSTFATLNAQIAALQTQADALRKKEIADVIAKIKDAIAHYGLTIEDLGLGKAAVKSALRPEASGGKSGSKPKKKAGSKRPTRPAKFKDDQGNTWSGLGKRPDWFKAALAAGKTPQELLAKG